VKSTSEQADALLHTVGVRPRDDLRVLRLKGDDQRTWLNGQVTSDIRNTKAGDAVYGLAVNVKGRVLTDLWVLDEGEALLVLVPESTLQTVRESLERQIIMEDVELAVDEQTRVLSAQGPRATAACVGLGGVYPCAELLDDAGCFVLVAAGERDAQLNALTAAAEREQGCAVDETGFILARLRVGRPALGLDFGERAYPQEAGLKGLAVSFSKGCYLGQEVVCTLEHRGKLSRRLVRLESIEGSASIGDELADSSGQTIGQITSCATETASGHTLALGYAKMAHALEGHELHGPHGRFVVRGTAGKD
jgi:folate-binding protein YgfZ